MEYKQLQALIRNFEKSSLTQLELETSDYKIRLSKNACSTVESDAIVKNSFEEKVLCQESEETSGFEVKSPLVGTFYRASGPNAKPFVSEGDEIVFGQTVCIIEAMKIMNEITSPVKGVVKKIMVGNGEPVGYNQVLMVIDCE